MATKTSPTPVLISTSQARRIWLHAQCLDREAFSDPGPQAVRACIEQLGYLQIDTINVIERCHHHILYNRLPHYQRADLRAAQSEEKTVFEYWTHALSYVPMRDFPFFVAEMKANRANPGLRFSATDRLDLMRQAVKRVRDEGALTISDIKDDELKAEKTHPWGSRKPSKAGLQAGFFCGYLAISERRGMLKTYELMERHFGWKRLPRAATETQRIAYLLDRALRSQGVVSLNSISFRHSHIRQPIKALIDQRVAAGELVPVRMAGAEALPHWAEPAVLEEKHEEPPLTHILSPFDPLIIQRDRTKLIFGYDHLFEAYLPAAQRKFGYFTLPVLVGENIVAMLDLKTDRQARELRIQAWHWAGKPRHKREIEKALAEFEKFQLAGT